MSRPVRTVFLGSGQFGLASLAELIQAGDDVEVVGVVTAPPRPAGRGNRAQATPIDEAARGLTRAPIVTVTRLGTAEAVESVLALDPEMAVLADFGQLVPKPILDLPLGALNLHPSLLPRHRGASPIPATILAGDTETGVTLMRMDEGLDTGPIVAQSRCPLVGNETAPQLEARLEIEAADLLIEHLGPWIRGQIEPWPQPEEVASMTRVIRREDGRLDPRKPAMLLERQVRAYQPWPGSFLDSATGRITVWRAGVAAYTGTASPGTLLDHRGSLALVTVDGILELLEAQPAGGKRMSGADLLRGRRRLAGTGVLAPTASSGQER